jgi:hypothetical protein
MNTVLKTPIVNFYFTKVGNFNDLRQLITGCEWEYLQLTKV